MSGHASTTDEVSVRIEKVVAEGDGLGRLPDGRVVFVRGGLPGELVTARVLKESRDYARAEVVSIVEANTRRVDPPCRFVAEGCGGCDFQHAAPDLQRVVKLDVVRESLQRLGRITDPNVTLAPESIDADGSRQTLRVAVAPDGRLGFRRRSSHEVVPVDRCVVADPRLDALLSSVVVDPRSGVEEIALRVGDDTVSADWEPDVPIDTLPPTVVTGRRATVSITVDGSVFTVSASSFFQSSAAAATALVVAVRRALGPVASWPAGRVIDAYGGVGLFALTAVPVEREVVVVESSRSAGHDARRNLAGRRATVVEADFETWRPLAAGVVIADPARIGLRHRGVATVAATGADVVILVSCDAASLGRDARLLVEAGFDLRSAEVLDLFPHTHHVEVVSRFERRARLSA